MKFAMLLSVAALGVAFGQGPMGPGRRGPMGFGAPGAAQQTPTFTDLKTYLGITDAQITQIQTLQKAAAANVQTLVQQLRAKEQSLRDLLAAGTTDAAAVGKVVLDADAIRKQIKAAHDGVQGQAVAVLFADQKTKLTALDAAAKLEPTIRQAQILDLLTPPANAAGGMGPRGFGPGGGMGMMRMRSPGN